MMTYGEIARQYIQQLKDLYPAEEARQLFLMAFGHITKKKEVYFSLQHTDEVAEEERPVFSTILTELLSARPIQHILGKADFYDMELKVNEHTLIPRPETEELVDRIVKEHSGQKGLHIMDVGTGSGCIALSLKKHLEDATVYAMEISSEAMKVARINATAENLNIAFIQADVLEWDAFIPDGFQLDIIVSNPPYIRPMEKEEMHQNVLLFEPHEALFVEEQAPLVFYDRISDMAKSCLRQDGKLYFEINQYLGAEMVELLQKKGFADVRICQDMQGVDRMVRATQRF